MPTIPEILLDSLKTRQAEAVKSEKRRVLVIAGAGSGKTEVMARRIAWWVGVEKVPRESIVAFTFTERAAEEMKFRIRRWLEKIAPAGQDVALGDMYVGTIHGFCIAKLREFWPDTYHNYDILDEPSRAALIQRGFSTLLGLSGVQKAITERRIKSGKMPHSRSATIEGFVATYDQLHEHDHFDCVLPKGDPPSELGPVEGEWCKAAQLKTKLGSTPEAKALAVSVARYYAYLRCRRFLDFSTSQTEFVRQLRNDKGRRRELEKSRLHVVVDEVQDVNPVQQQLVQLLVGDYGNLTAVGDHRQAIYGFRGAKVEIVAELWEQFNKAPDSEVVDLQENFRSTPRIINLANSWASTIGQVRSMETSPMTHGTPSRMDQHPSHIAMVGFKTRELEADWIAKAIRILVPAGKQGAAHDNKNQGRRGITLSDIVVLVRSSTNVRTYMESLEESGIPCVVRAGPDLFSQPEILLFVSALAVTADVSEFYGSPNRPKSLPGRIATVLGCDPKPKPTFREAAKQLRQAGLRFEAATEERLLLACEALRLRIKENQNPSPKQLAALRTPKLKEFLGARNEIRRIFPQQLFHMLLSEAQIEAWDTCEGRGQTALYHLGALSALITGIETPGWTSVKDYHYQVIGLCQYGAEDGRAEEQPLMVQPDAVNISTVHGVKGLEFAAVFLADVCAGRFPSNYARRAPDLPISGKIVRQLDIPALADNANHDGERRLMYVAITRSERFLFVSRSGTKTSSFIKELEPLVRECGGIVATKPKQLLEELRYAPKEHRRDVRLTTSFSDLRYYLECPHDFYLRKVLGFAPTIDQAFGYGRGVHNLTRAVHSDPKKWAKLAANPDKTLLSKEIGKLVERGLFYLRYTTGAPAENMREKGMRIVADYIDRYKSELAKVTFEPEKPFETLVEYEDGDGGALISGAIDVVRQDNPPRVTLIDFKSGHPESDKHQKLTKDEMQFQVSLYAIAAKKELEYQPDKGLVRYLDIRDDSIEKPELDIPLDEETLVKTKSVISATATRIRERKFVGGPVIEEGAKHRCAGCDFVGFCGMKPATDFKKANPQNW
jgi:DNA helicase-2/ATP-dependent DNA helicase PcrA